MSKKNQETHEVLIEIPMHSSVKYECDKETGRIKVDRFLRGTNVYPGNYGFFPDTLEDDGDPLDVLVLSSHPVLPGSRMDIKIIGALGMIDDGENDTKVIAVFVGDAPFAVFQDYQDLPAVTRASIVDFFANYKNLEQKKVEILEWHSAEATKKILAESYARLTP